MDETEMAFYISREQLLLLLSLIDERPVEGLPPVSKDADWNETALSLFQDGILHTEEEQLVMDSDLVPPLYAMKDAQQVYVLYRKRPEPVCHVLYLGKRSARLETAERGPCRLAEMTQELCNTQIVQEIFSGDPVPEETAQSLRAWSDQQEKLSAEELAEQWQKNDGMRSILERRMPQEKQMRWLWLEDDAARLILRQDSGGAIHAVPDTLAYRKQLLRELGLEVKEYDAG